MCLASGWWLVIGVRFWLIGDAWNSFRRFFWDPGDALESSGRHLDLNGRSLEVQDHYLVIWSFIMEARGHRFRVQIVFWTITFRCIPWKWFMESVSVDLWWFREAPELKKPRISLYCLSKSRFEQRASEMRSGGLLAPFFMILGVALGRLAIIMDILGASVLQCVFDRI